MEEEVKEEIQKEPVIECCDKPRGFVGSACDYCGGIVQPEEE